MKRFFVVIAIFAVMISASAAQATTGDYYWARVVNCNEWISLREYPSTSAPRLAKIPLGTVVKVSKYHGMDGANPSPCDGFIRTQYNGQYGWCLMDYLRIEEYAGGAP